MMKIVKAWAVLAPRSLKPLAAGTRDGHVVMALPVAATKEAAKRIASDWRFSFSRMRIVRVEIREVTT